MAAEIVSDLTPPALTIGYDAGIVVFTIVDAVCGMPVTAYLDVIKQRAGARNSSQ